MTESQELLIERLQKFREDSDLLVESILSEFTLTDDLKYAMQGVAVAFLNLSKALCGTTIKETKH